jgi:MFS family permease
MYRLTGSTFLVGAVVFAQFMGTLVLAPWAGVAADRFDRRSLLMVLQSLAAVPTAVLAIAEARSSSTPLLVIVATGLIGIAQALSSPARQALVPMLVDPGDVDGVVALHAVTYQIARAIGPVIGAAIIAVAGMPLAIGVNGVSFLLFVAALSRLRPAVQPRANVHRSFASTARRAWSDARTRNLLLAIMAVSVASDPPLTLAPSYIGILGHPDSAAGLLMGGFGVGALIVGLFLAPRMRMWRYGFHGAVSAELVGIVLFAVSPGLAISLVALALAGGGYVGALTQATTNLQRLAPPDALGRYMALWGLAFLGMRPVAALLDGAVAELLGVRVAAGLMAVPLVACFVLLPARAATDTDLQTKESPYERNRHD